MVQSSNCPRPYPLRTVLVRRQEPQQRERRRRRNGSQLPYRFESQLASQQQRQLLRKTTKRKTDTDVQRYPQLAAKTSIRASASSVTLFCLFLSFNELFLLLLSWAFVSDVQLYEYTPGVEIGRHWPNATRHKGTSRNIGVRLHFYLRSIGRLRKGRLC